MWQVEWDVNVIPLMKVEISIYDAKMTDVLIIIII